MNTTPIMAVMDKPHACDGKPTWWWFTSDRTRDVDIPPQLWQDHTLKQQTVAGRMTEAHRRALKTCAVCPLALTCLQASWDTEQHGTFGGLSETERWAFGGRGRSGGNQQQTPERRARILERLARRFADRSHPVIVWLEQLPVVRSDRAEREITEQLRRELGDLVMDMLEDGAVA